MISHEYKCIFIHIPKCAGTSVESAFGHFDDQGGTIVQDHRSIRMIEPLALAPALKSRSNRRELVRKIAHRLRPNPGKNNKATVTRQQYHDYFKFAIVRNPWTRAVSFYKNVMDDPTHRRELDVRDDATLAEFLTAHAGKGLLRPQLDWITDWRGKMPLDFVCRFENLSKDFESVVEQLGGPPIELPRINLVKWDAASPKFDQPLSRLIADVYAEEIALFGYAPPEEVT